MRVDDLPESFLESPQIWMPFSCRMENAFDKDPTETIEEETVRLELLTGLGTKAAGSYGGFGLRFTSRKASG
jgi:hypothetical protein